VRELFSSADGPSAPSIVFVQQKQLLLHYMVYLDVPSAPPPHGYFKMLFPELF